MILKCTESAIICIQVACFLTPFAIFFILIRCLYLLSRFSKKGTERIEIPVLSSIVQHEFEGLEHFDPVHGVLPFELREKLSLWVI